MYIFCLINECVTFIKNLYISDHNSRINTFYRPINCIRLDKLRMEITKLNNSNIAEYLNKDYIVRRTAEQIMKDLNMFGINITFSGDVSHAYEELFAQLSEQISDLMSMNYSKLLSVLYQVDISEKDIYRAYAELPEYDDTEVIAHQIIVRDLKKVLTLEYFKTNS